LLDREILLLPISGSMTHADLPLRSSAGPLAVAKFLRMIEWLGQILRVRATA
jgi:hypothetical protein